MFARVMQIADIRAKAQPNACADRGQHNVTAALIVHADATDEIRRAIDTWKALGRS